MRARLGGVAAAATIVLWSSTAFADAIVITSGLVTLSWDGGKAGFALVGAGTSLIAETEQMAPGGCCITAGPVDLSSTVYARRMEFNQPLPVTVNGTQYVIFPSATLQFTAAPLVIPASPGATDVVVFSTPFTMTGQYSGYANSDLTGTPLFMLAVTGSGTARFGPFHAVDPAGTVYAGSPGLSYLFETSSSPTPEPATMLLFASGLAVGARRFRSRR